MCSSLASLSPCFIKAISQIYSSASAPVCTFLLLAGLLLAVRVAHFALVELVSDALLLRLLRDQPVDLVLVTPRLVRVRFRFLFLLLLQQPLALVTKRNTCAASCTWVITERREKWWSARARGRTAIPMFHIAGLLVLRTSLSSRSLSSSVFGTNTSSKQPATQKWDETSLDKAENSGEACLEIFESPSLSSHFACFRYLSLQMYFMRSSVSWRL